ncbi:MAG TPA: glycine zipper 2TM domain-containing protein [Burkholderiales bacterium]|nr:glycine zipper 2TM domain-containing protein [Burkholderiales bacterium]
MSARRILHVLAIGALLGASLPAFADHDRRDRSPRHRADRVVVEHRHAPRVVHRPVYVERRIVERPVYVDRPVYVERPAPVYDPGYGPVYDTRGYDPRYDSHPVYEQAPVAYPMHREPNVLGTAAGAVIGAVIGSQVGYGPYRGAATAVGAVLGGVLGSQF